MSGNKKWISPPAAEYIAMGIVGVIFIAFLVFMFFFCPPDTAGSPSRHVDRIGDRLRNEAQQEVELIPPPQEEIEGEFTIDDKTIITLDGKPIAFENVPKDGSVEVAELLVDLEKKRVVRLGLRTVKATKP